MSCFRAIVPICRLSIIPDCSLSNRVVYYDYRVVHRVDRRSRVAFLENRIRPDGTLRTAPAPHNRRSPGGNGYYQQRLRAGYYPTGQCGLIYQQHMYMDGFGGLKQKYWIQGLEMYIRPYQVEAKRSSVSATR